MAEEKQLSPPETLYVVGRHDENQLALGNRTNVTEILKCTYDNDALPKKMNVHNGFMFAILSANNHKLGPFNFVLPRNVEMMIRRSKVFKFSNGFQRL